MDYERSQLDLSEYNQECDTLSNSDTPQVFDVDLDDTVSIARTKNHHRWQILSDSEDEQIPILPTSRNTEVWFNPLGKQPSIIPYTECPGLKPFSLRSSMSSAKPSEFYSLLVPDIQVHNRRNKSLCFTNLEQKCNKIIPNAEMDAYRLP